MPLTVKVQFDTDHLRDQLKDIVREVVREERGGPATIINNAGDTAKSGATAAADLLHFASSMRRTIGSFFR